MRLAGNCFRVQNAISSPEAWKDALWEKKVEFAEEEHVKEVVNLGLLTRCWLSHVGGCADIF